MRLPDGITRIDTDLGLEEALKAEQAMLFKHSPRCPVSVWALTEVEEFARRRPATPVYLVDVLAQRPLSQRIAADLGIPHESPQAILLQRGKPLWHGSHSEVTADALSRHVRQD